LDEYAKKLRAPIQVHGGHRIMKAAGCVSGSLLGEKLSEESFSPDPFSKTFIPFL
jgi:hypothetical protein